MQTSTRSNFMDFIRWLSALFVVLSHLRSVLFVDYNMVSTNKNGLLKLFYFFTGLGHQAVVIFFILSGYLITQTIIKQVKKGSFSFIDYLINRVSRLYSVLFVALLLTLFFDYLGKHFDACGIYDNSFHFAAMNYSVNEHSSANYFFSSLFMLQNITLPPLGSNAPLWSLNYEFWYYILFPSIFIPIYSIAKKNKMNVAGYAIAAVIMVVFIPSIILLYSIIWLLGLIPFLWSLNNKLFKFLLPVLMIVLMAADKFKLTHFNPFINDILLGVVFSFWLSTFSTTNESSVFVTLNKKLSSFSYTLYLIHFPVILCTLTVINFYFKQGIAMQPGFISFAIFVILIPFTFLFAYFTATFTEFRTTKLKENLKKIVSNFKKS